MSPINFLPWYEKREIDYRRFYIKIIVLISFIFLMLLTSIFFYLQPKAEPPVMATKRAHASVKRCNDKFLSSLTLQAILSSESQTKIIAQNEQGKTFILDAFNLDCWQLLAQQSDSLSVKNKEDGKAVEWKLGQRLK